MQKAGQGLVGAVEGYKCPASLPLGKAAGHTDLALNRGPGQEVAGHTYLALAGGPGQEVTQITRLNIVSNKSF